MVRRWLGDLIGEPPSLLPIVLYDFLRAGPWRSLRTFFFMLQNHIEANLPLIQVPGLVVSGCRDPIAPPPWVEEVTRRLPDGRFILIASAPHAVNYAAPDDLARVVRAFLGRNR